MAVTADDLDVAVSTTIDTLRPAADRDWSVVAEALQHTCWQAAEHIGDTLMAYAANIGARATTHYVRFMASADKDASPADVLEFTEAGGRMLVAMVRVSGPDVRAFHPSGMADPAGFAGMGCVEALVHGYDIADALGLALDPPRDVCTRVIARMFPEHAGDLAGIDAWRALLWAAGRIELPGRPRRQGWRWHGAPIG